MSEIDRGQILCSRQIDSALLCRKMVKQNHAARIEKLEAGVTDLKSSIRDLKSSIRDFHIKQDQMMVMLAELLRSTPDRSSEASSVPIQRSNRETMSSNKLMKF